MKWIMDSIKLILYNELFFNDYEMNWIIEEMRSITYTHARPKTFLPDSIFDSQSLDFDRHWMEPCVCQSQCLATDA